MSIRKRYPLLVWGIVDTLGLLLLPSITVGSVRGLDFGPLEPSELNTLIACVMVYLCATALLYRPRTPPGFKTLGEAVPMIAALFGLLVLTIVIFRVGYSRPFLLVFFGLSVLWFQLRILLALRWSYKSFCVIPQGETGGLLKLRGRVSCKELQSAQLQPGSAYHDGIVVDSRTSMDDEWDRLLTLAKLRRIPIFDVAAIYEAVSGRVSMRHMKHNHLGVFLPPRYYSHLKRTGDIVVASALLIASAPLFLVIMLLIRLNSPGQILFRQQRITRGGRVFDMLKFRTMTQQASDSPFRSSTRSHDARITHVGSVLRHFHLDELPQLWNVIKGDMSIVGPRPAVAENHKANQRTIPFYRHRHLVRPGITGWAQVSQGYALDEDLQSTREKIERDLYYIKHMSPWLDVVILVMTVITVLSGRGAR